jgi:hypothetical protein
VLDQPGRERRPRHDRLADDAVLPGDQVAVRVQPGLHRVVVGRPVAAALHVVLARPQHLDRRLGADRLQRAHHLDDDVGIGHRPAPEEAAGRHRVQLHLPGLEAHDVGTHLL